MIIAQTPVGHNKEATVAHTLDQVRKAAKTNPSAKLAILPESFNCPYGPEYFRKYSEPVPNGPTCKALSQLAKELRIFIIGGSIMELADNNVYNTSTIWGPSGEFIGRHRKIHLFAVDIKKENLGLGCTFTEFTELTAGKDITTFEIEGRKFGVGVCHDIRFDELAKIYRLEGTEAMIYPAAFCICQGPMHLKMLQQARAIDNGMYVATVCCARDLTPEYVAWGHSMIVDPWGQTIAEAGEGEEIMIVDFDFTRVDEYRKQIPIFDQRRTDLYSLVYKKN